MTDVPANRVMHDGQHYPVNGHWHEANTAPWPHLAATTRQQLREIQDALLLKSNDEPLSKDELAYLRAANNHFDVRTAIGFLRGRDHREFGFEGVDQVHGQWERLECGCRLAFVFDHHKARADEPYEVHPHTPLPICDSHAPYQHDVKLLHERAVADNRSPEG